MSGDEGGGNKMADEWSDYCRKEIKSWMSRARQAISDGEEVPPIPDLGPPPFMPPDPHHGPPPHPPPHPRTNVIASRIGDEELRAVDMLVEAGLFGTRSEAVAYLVSEGIKARRDVMEQVTRSLEEIREITRKKEEQVKKLRENLGIGGD